MRKIIIGSRDSRLAVVQSEMVIAALRESHPEIQVDLLTMKTTGDKILDRRLDEIGGKGLFVKELDKALMDRRSDYSVHSMKDLPMEVPKELPLVCCSRREDPRDVLVLPAGVAELDLSKPIGTSSRRRILQLRELFPEAVFESVRGNLQTRLRKLDSGEYSALILAAAGLKRLGLEDRISRYFSPEEIIPAACQGILAVQGRADEDHSVFDGFRDEDTEIRAAAERAFVRTLDGGCSSPTAAYAEIVQDEGSDIRYLKLTGLYYDEENDCIEKGILEGALEQAETIGQRLAERLSAVCI